MLSMVLALMPSIEKSCLGGLEQFAFNCVLILAVASALTGIDGTINR